MGLEISENKKRDYLINIIESYLKVNVDLMSYFKALAKDRKGKLTCTKSIRSTERAINHLRQIKHIEILEYLYSIFIGNNAMAYAVSGSMVLSSKIKEWDTEEGIVEFRDLIEKQKQENELKQKQAQEKIDAMKKAKEEGKDVELVYDNESKGLKPLIVDEKPNA